MTKDALRQSSVRTATEFRRLPQRRSVGQHVAPSLLGWLIHCCSVPCRHSRYESDSWSPWSRSRPKTEKGPSQEYLTNVVIYFLVPLRSAIGKPDHYCSPTSISIYVQISFALDARLMDAIVSLTTILRNLRRYLLIPYSTAHNAVTVAGMIPSAAFRC